MSKDEELVKSLLGDVVGQLDVLSPIEKRLVNLTNTLLPNMLLMLRMVPQGSGAPVILPLTVELIGQATHLAMASAVTMDDELRALRSNLSERGGGK